MIQELIKLSERLEKESTECILFGDLEKSCSLERDKSEVNNIIRRYEESGVLDRIGAEALLNEYGIVISE